MRTFRAIRLTGLAVFVAALALVATQYLPSPAEAVFDDSDGDGVIDLAEQLTGSDPLDSASFPESTGTDVVGGINTCNDGIDNDGDGLTDLDDTFCIDSDGDIVSDPGEVLLGSDPNNSGSFPEDSRLDTVLDYYGIPIFFCGDAFDNDQDGLIDGADPGCTPIGSDGDDFDDATEKRFGSDPTNANSVPEHELVNPGSCSDGIDNDLDGLMDQADPACSIPGNDNRAGAVLIPSIPFSDGPLVMKNATTEPSEARPSCVFGGVNASVWYRYTATADDVLIADTAGSNFETTLAVWRQDGAGLDEFACAAFLPNTRVVFDVSAGETYFFQVGGFPSFQGLPELSFHVAQGNPPENDGFLDATAIAGLPFDDTADLTAARTEFAEPSPFCAGIDGASTVWYTFEADADTLVLLETSGSDFPSFIGVWRQTVFGLHDVDCGAAFAPDEGARIAFEAEGGRTYYFQVGRQPYGGPGQDGFSLSFRAEVVTPAANDDFAGAAAIASLPFHGSIDTLTLTQEPGEPSPSCLFYEEPASTAWYKFTPATDTILRADTEGTFFFSSFIGIYTGTSISTLDEVGCAYPNYPYTQFAFEASAGQTYYFQVGTLLYGGRFFGPLAASDRGWGREPSVAGGVPVPPPGGSSTKLFFNLDSFSVPSCAAPQFTVADPLGDQIGFEEPPIIEGDAAGIAPPPGGFERHDIVSISGGSNSTDFCLTVEFAGPIDPPDANTERSVVGYVSFDTDADRQTGYGAGGDYYCQQPSGLGVEAEAYMFGGTGVLVPISTFLGLPEGEEPAFAVARFHDQSFSLIVPLGALGGDSSFNFAMVLGSTFEPTDCAPNGGSIHSPDGSIVSPWMPGDVNCNNSPGPVDASLILQLTAGLVETLPCEEAGDVNGDGRVDALDASLLLQFVADVIPSLPAPRG